MIHIILYKCYAILLIIAHELKNIQYMISKSKFRNQIQGK